MTDWTQEQITAHRTNINNFKCFGAAITYTHGVTVYPQYFMVKKTEITCKTCGAWKDKYQEDLYECDWQGNRITKSAKATSSAATASVATFSMMADEMPVEDIAVAEPENEIVVNGDETATDEIEAVVPADEVLVEDAENAEESVISGNGAVSENNVSINQ